VSILQRYIDAFGPEAGPKIHQAVKSRAAYKGVSTRRRHRIEALTGRPYRLRRRAPAARGQGLLPLAPAEADPSGTSGLPQGGFGGPVSGTGPAPVLDVLSPGVGRECGLEVDRGAGTEQDR
jgi:hypothetical protein